MDGIDKQKFPGIIIVAATNKAEQIDLALFRSERFGKKLLISFPEKDEIKDIIKITLDMFYEDCKNYPVFFGNKSRAAFTKEFTDYIFKEITENKEYEITQMNLLRESQDMIMTTKLEREHQKKYLMRTK